MNSLYQVDDLVKEYLLFRGFTNTFRALETESRTDKDKGFQVDKILEELLSFITNGDVNGLVEYYRYLDIRFFSRLDTRFQQTIKKFELCLLRHYLIHAIQHKKREKVKEFFEVYGPDLHGLSEWSEWFALPYVKQPSSDPVFESFFTKQWVDNYTTSLHNFLATIFQKMPLPSLLAFNVDRSQRKSQQAEIENLKMTVDNMKAMMDAKENEIAKLKVELLDTRKEMTDGISLIRKRAASMTSSQQNMTNGLRSDSTISSNCTTPSTVSTTINPITATITSPSHDSTINTNNNTADTSNHLTETDEPFVIVSQEEFSEHASAITHAKFSIQGNLIASCDMDNIVRVWSYKGQSHSPQKLTSNTSSILSLEWDARSDRFLFLGTNSGNIRVYNTENRSVVQEFSMTEKYPWITQLSSNPVEPVIVCSASGDKIRRSSKGHGALVAWSMKSMSSSGVFKLEPEDTCTDINTIKHNHNGQMLVAGDGVGTMRIFDVRTMKSIVEWKTLSKRPACIAQFSFDENSIYTVDHGGQLSQWSIHKPGVSLSNTYLQGFPPPPAYSSQSTRPSTLVTTPHPSLSSPANSSSSSSIPSPSAPTTTLPPPRPSSNRSTSSRASISSSRSARLSSVLDEGVNQSILSVTPRSQMVAFSADTDYILCATSSSSFTDNNNNTNIALPPTVSSSSSSSHSPSSSSSSSSLTSLSSGSQSSVQNNKTTSAITGETQGTIYQSPEGKPVLQFGQHHVYRKITTVDWTGVSNACLLGSADGSVKITHLIKTSY
ncbi:WD40-repeat-containing domain protein [Halteromyces radiatus]|uniref:WD40-repeat-containing domain protein n=1 Tax=Halteromyces radiatus TaxID=101107 RepID=UPI00221F3DEA|nr:WD40-repeat-containing domain protein [Halteromyces radiatus]KAI8099668.1 WD40-repeat-containing domain protein [Halteromyces radiatus]